MTKITLLNPHADDFVAGPVSFNFMKRRALKKYAYLMTEQIAQRRKVDILLDGTLSSYFNQDFFVKLPKWFRIRFLKWEIKKWIDINDLHGQVNVHWTPDTIEDKGILYLFSYKNCTGVFEKRRPFIEAFKLKVINLSHFMIRTAEKGRNAQSLENVVYTSEADISSTPFFVKHFGENHPFIVLPFVVPERFICLKSFDERSDVCAATGSFHRLKLEKPQEYYQDFMTFFETDTYHPIRKEIYENHEELKDYIDCKVSPYRENGHSIFARFDIAQKKYFSFDIVEFYNDHKYSLIGEEVHGLVAIGSFEAMACGCTLLAQKGPFYEGIGMEPDVHFVEHDGTIEGIKGVIDELRANPEKSQKIAENALAFIKDNCKSSKIWNSLVERLKQP